MGIALTENSVVCARPSANWNTASRLAMLPVRANARCSAWMLARMATGT